MFNQSHNSRRFRLFYITEEPESINMNGRRRATNREPHNGLPTHQNRCYQTCKTFNRLRTLIAFWILGLCNNYGYTIMLNVAYDILSDRFNITQVRF